MIFSYFFVWTLLPCTCSKFFTLGVEQWQADHDFQESLSGGPFLRSNTISFARSHKSPSIVPFSQGLPLIPDLKPTTLLICCVFHALWTELCLQKTWEGRKSFQFLKAPKRWFIVSQSIPSVGSFRMNGFVFSTIFSVRSCDGIVSENERLRGFVSGVYQDGHLLTGQDMNRLSWLTATSWLWDAVKFWAFFHEDFGGFSEHFSDFDLQSEHFIVKISWFLPAKRLPSEVPKSDGHSKIQQACQEECWQISVSRQCLWKARKKWMHPYFPATGQFTKGNGESTVMKWSWVKLACVFLVIKNNGKKVTMSREI